MNGESKRPSRPTGNREGRRNSTTLSERRKRKVRQYCYPFWLLPLESPRMVSERYSEEFYWGASREFFDGVLVRWRLNCSLVHFVGRFCQAHVCYSLAGRSVLGETVPEVLSTARGRRPRGVLRPRAQFLPIRTNLGRWITFLFFFLLIF